MEGSTKNIVFRGGSRIFCQAEANPKRHPELKPVNSVICEQTLSFTNHYTNMKVMNGPRYNFFWIYILDLHNNYIEDNRLLRVNPLSPICMNEILIKQAWEAISSGIV